MSEWFRCLAELEHGEWADPDGSYALDGLPREERRRSFFFSRALAAVPALSSVYTGYTGYTVIHVPFSPSPDYSRVRLCFIVLLLLVLLYICITVVLVIPDRETPTFFLLTGSLFLLVYYRTLCPCLSGRETPTFFLLTELLFLLWTILLRFRLTIETLSLFVR